MISFSGEILLIVTFVTLGLEGIIGLVFYFKRWKWRWWYTSIFALFALIYFIAGRWGFEIKNCIDYHFTNISTTSNSPEESVLISKAFLLDMCPFLILVLSLMSLLKQTRTYANILAPIAFFTSISTLCLAIPTYNEPLTVQYVFLGIYPNLMFFMMHFLLMILSMMLMMTTHKYKSWWLSIAFLTIGIYIAYIFVIQHITGVNWNLTGLTRNDWITYNSISDGFIISYYGEYQQLGNFFHLTYPTTTILLYVISAIIVIIFIYINNLIHFVLNRILIRSLIKKHPELIDKIKAVVTINKNKK